MSNFQICSEIKVSIPEVINEDNVTFYDICIEVRYLYYSCVSICMSFFSTQASQSSTVLGNEARHVGFRFRNIVIFYLFRNFFVVGGFRITGSVGTIRFKLMSDE
jgi:hypothetical protein